MDQLAPHPAQDRIAAALDGLSVRGAARGLVPGRRTLVAAALAGGAVAAVLLLGDKAQTFADALARAVSADPAWVGVAVGAEALSFVGYVALLWLVAGAASRRVDLRASYRLTMGGAAATRLLPTAGLGGVAFTLWGLRRLGQDTAGAARTLLRFLVLLYAVFFGALMVAGTLVTVRGDGPVGLAGGVAVTAALVLGTGLSLALWAGRAGAGEGSDSARTAGGGGLRGRLSLGALGRPALALGRAVRDAAGTLRGADVRLGGAVVWWGADVAVLWAVFHAVGAPPEAGVLVLAYFLGAVANTIPLPGSASGGLIGVLLAFGVAADLAIAAVLAYRAIAIWLPAPFGLAALLSLRGSAPTEQRAAAPASASAPASHAACCA